MTDLSIASPPHASAAAAVPTASTLLRAVPASDGTPQSKASPFQDALALELGLELDRRLLPGPGIPAAAATRPTAYPLLRTTSADDGTPQSNNSPPQDPLALELGLWLDRPSHPGGDIAAAAAKAGRDLAPGEDTAPAALVPDALIGLASAGVPQLPSAAASFSPPAARAAAVPAAAEPAALTLDSRNDPLARPLPGLRAEPGMPADAAANLALPGRISAFGEGEIRREIAFDTSLLDQHKAGPAPAAATHTDSFAPAPVTPAPVAALDARVGERNWDQGLGEKLVWMASQKQQVAELHLNPPDLGPLKITLTLSHDQASAEFVSAHAQVREAIETAMPRLREMLADNGITLGNASVSTDAFREQPQHEPRAYRAAPAAAAAEPVAVTRGERLLRRSHGLVDTFA